MEGEEEEEPTGRETLVVILRLYGTSSCLDEDDGNSRMYLFLILTRWRCMSASMLIVNKAAFPRIPPIRSTLRESLTNLKLETNMFKNALGITCFCDGNFLFPEADGGGVQQRFFGETK